MAKNKEKFLVVYQYQGFRVRQEKSGFYIYAGKKRRCNDPFSSLEECKKVIVGIVEKKYFYRKYWEN